MATEWVDFKKVKEAVDMQMVLDHYGIDGLRKSGDELRGPCPIHKGSARSKNFTVNVRKNAFNCFSRNCGARGNVIDFVAAMEQCSIRWAALKLKAWFRIGESPLPSPKQGEDTSKRAELPRGVYRDRNGALYELLFTAVSAEDSEPLVVYQELFGDYAHYIAGAEEFVKGDEGQESPFTLVKAL